MTQENQDTGQDTALVETAVVKLNPNADIAVQEFYAQALKLRTFAKSLTVESADDSKVATDTLSTISTLKKRLEEKRKEFVGPLNAYVKEVNDAFRALAEPINEADRTVRDRMAAYLKAQDDRRKEEARVNALKLEAAEAEARLKGEPVKPVPILHSPAPQRTVTSSGAVGGRKTWKWALEDLSQVPKEYLMLNETLVGKVVGAGIRAIPGIRIYEDLVVVVEANPHKPVKEATPDAPDAPF